MSVSDEKSEQLRRESERDLGFGSVVSRESQQRLLNRDGSFNVRREGMPRLASLSLYLHLLATTWPRFLGWLVVAYLATTGLFGLGFAALGSGALASHAHRGIASLLECFFFSVETFSTIGYGNVYPVSLGAHLLVTAEALVGILGFALATGLVFARFSRPTSRILFSRHAVIAPYRGGTALELRIVNARSSQILHLEARVILSLQRDGGSERKFYSLELERGEVEFFPLSWTLVHPIVSESPLWGLDANALAAADPEVIVLLRGFDETFSGTVQTRSSYKAHEIVWGARFVDIFNPRTRDGHVSIDVSKLHGIETAPLAAPPRD